MSAAGRVAPVQPMRSPYLITNGAGRHGVAVSVAADASSMAVELTVRGRWSPDLGGQVVDDLQLCLAGPPTAIIVDLHDLDDLHGVSRRFWLAAGRSAQFRPTPARISLCLPAETMLAFRLRRLEGHQRFLHATMPEARAAVAEQHSLLDRAQARLAPRPASVPVARDLVTRACQAWDMPEVCADAALIITELAANAVEHARTEFVVTASRDEGSVHLAVRDRAAQLPRPSEPAFPRARLSGPAGPGARLSGPAAPSARLSPASPDALLSGPASPGARLSGSASPGARIRMDERGRGLLLVHAIAAAWGAMPAHGGKVVWATVTRQPR